MTIKDDIKDQILRRLGSDKVEIELEDSTIKNTIEEAVEMVRPYLTQTEYMEIDSGGGVRSCVDLSDENILNVVRVLESPRMHRAGDVDLFRTINYAEGDLSNTIANVALRNKRISQIKDLVKKSFKFIDGKLYLDGYRGNVVIEYMENINDVEDIKEEWAYKWVYQYAVSLCKEMLGRIRGKISVDGSSYDLDGDTLLNEAENEKQRLEQQLEDGRGFFFIARG